MKFYNTKDNLGVSDEAMNVALDMVEASDLMGQYESSTNGKPYDPKNPPPEGDPSTFMRTMGSEFDKKYGFSMVPGLSESGSSLAARIAWYARTIRAMKPDGASFTVEEIDEALKEDRPETIIQGLITLSKAKSKK
jgi:hypothetical protein